MIFAYNRRSHDTWLRQVRSDALFSTVGRGLTGGELEHVIMALAVSNPDLVAVVVG